MLGPSRRWSAFALILAGAPVWAQEVKPTPVERVSRAPLEGPQVLRADLGAQLRTSSGPIEIFSPGWFLSELAGERVNAHLSKNASELADLQAQNESLRKSLTARAAGPEITGSGLPLLALALGLLLGGAAVYFLAPSSPPATPKDSTP